MSQRKSVSFETSATIISSEDNVTMSEIHETDSAARHSSDPVAETEEKMEAVSLDEPKKEKAGGEDGEADFSKLKKKKKKTKTAAESFEAELKKTKKKEGSEEAESKEKAEPEAVPEGDFQKGTGIWAHDATQNIPYKMLLSRFFTLLHADHPLLAGASAKSYKIPPPQMMREGSKKTVFANIADISQRLQRTQEHVTQFLFAELGTSGSVDGSRRLIIKGRFQQKQIEQVLRGYIIEYVSCRTCRSMDTELSKGENRLYFVTCKSCGSRRSVTTIKTGFTAQIGKRRKQQG